MIVGVAALAMASAAYATKPGSGSTTGTASVFAPNPVQDLRIQTLTDQKDAAAAVPAAGYHSVTLTDLDGSGTLSGKWAVIRSETGAPAYSPTRSPGYFLPSSRRLRQCGTDEVYDVESQSATHAGSGDGTPSLVPTPSVTVTAQ
jgi:hypothetical protein